ncbi:MAG: DUF5615 family PIN-like protein [Candidatus Rokuibacteriota bacterium]
MKFYLDENLSAGIARILKQKGLDATSAQEVGNAGLDDRAQLAYASGDGRAIVTANVVDFLALAHQAVATNTEHAGIILVPPSFRGDEFKAIANDLDDAAKQYPEGVPGAVIYVGGKPARQPAAGT